MYLSKKGSIMTDSEAVANKFNKYFIDVSHDLINLLKQRFTTKIISANLMNIIFISMILCQKRLTSR